MGLVSSSAGIIFRWCSRFYNHNNKGNGLSGGGSFTTNTGSNGTISLAVGVDDSTIELNSDEVRIKDSGVTLQNSSGKKAGTNLKH